MAARAEDSRSFNIRTVLEIHAPLWSDSQHALAEPRQWSQNISSVTSSLVNAKVTSNTQSDASADVSGPDVGQCGDELVSSGG